MAETTGRGCDPLGGVDAYFASVRKRLENGVRDYGDKSFGRDPRVLIREMIEEVDDIAGWGYILRVRLMRMMEALGPPVRDLAHPGEMLAEWMQENLISPREVDRAASADGEGGELRWRNVEMIAQCRMPVRADAAEALARVTGIPAHVWMAMQYNYDQERERANGDPT